MTLHTKTHCSQNSPLHLHVRKTRPHWKKPLTVAQFLQHVHTEETNHKSLLPLYFMVTIFKLLRPLIHLYSTEWLTEKYITRSRETVRFMAEERQPTVEIYVIYGFRHSLATHAQKWQAVQCCPLAWLLSFLDKQQTVLPAYTTLYNNISNCIHTNWLEGGRILGVKQEGGVHPLWQMWQYIHVGQLVSAIALMTLGQHQSNLWNTKCF
jgi:hypothetical protein